MARIVLSGNLRLYTEGVTELELESGSIRSLIRELRRRYPDIPEDIEDELGMAIIDGIANGVLDDMPIWDHKSYVAQPILCDGDGPINKFRKWVSQFYSDPLQAR